MAYGKSDMYCGQYYEVQRPDPTKRRWVVVNREHNYVYESMTRLYLANQVAYLRNELAAAHAKDK